MTRNDALDLLRDALPDLRRRFGLVRLGLFGSVSRNEAGDESDVDLVAEFAPDVKLGLFELFAVEQDLAARLGRPVTIADLSRMNRFVRASVERDLVYAE